MTEIIRITDPEKIDEIAKLADEIWHECYKGIISDAQIDYMVDNFQSKEAMLELYGKGAEFYAVDDDGKTMGYVVLEKEEDALFLSKLYILSSIRGKGYGSLALSFVKRRANGVRQRISPRQQIQRPCDKVVSGKRLRQRTRPRYRDRKRFRDGRSHNARESGMRFRKSP